MASFSGPDYDLPTVSGVNDQSINEILGIFGDLLEQRFAREVYTTEDSIRYTFFAALTQVGFAPDQVILEYPHPVISRGQVDTWIEDYKGKPLAVEFKFDRDPPSGKNQPKTYKAGAVFKDLRRLSLTAVGADVYALFVYVTTREMAVYFRNAANGHVELFDFEPGCQVQIRQQYFEGKPKTFLGAIGEPFMADILCLYKKTLPGGNELRVYGVESAHVLADATP